MIDILKKYVCLNPFRYIDIQPNSQWVCCPSWCPTDIRVDKEGKPANGSEINFDEDLKKNWFSETVKDIRLSVTDGTYRHCNHKVCPSLSQLINTGKKPDNFISIERFNKEYDLETFTGLPEEILFGFDRSCNLRCPSCRADFIPNDDPKSRDHAVKEFILESIEDEFGSSVKNLMITGSGDPIYSKLYRDYLINFDASKYPKLEQIHLITNGVLLTEKMWQKMKARPYVKTMEISIDAGCKDTYENITRLNGDWDALIENLKFLSKETSIRYIACSMVVSKHNYKEMNLFYNLIHDIFKNSSFSFRVVYRQLVHWFTGAFSIQDVNNLSIFDPIHPDFQTFLTELKTVANKDYVEHNFHHLLK